MTDPITRLAQTIQGEAATSTGQYGVANVIQNRFNAGGFPGASGGLVGLVSAPQQFVGFSANPSPQAMGIATELYNGNLSQNPVGNATYFQSGQTAFDNGLAPKGLNIEGNYFSDRFGAPSDNFTGFNSSTGAINPDESALGSGADQPTNPPIGNIAGADQGYFGSGIDTGVNPNDQPLHDTFGQGIDAGIAPGSTNSGDFGMDIAPSSGVSFAGLGGQSSAIGGQASDVGGSGSGLPGPVSEAGLGGNSISQSGSEMSGIGNNSQQQFAQVQGISGADTPSSSGTDSGSGVPVDITDPTVIASKAGADVKQGAEQLGTKIQGTGQALDSALGQDTQSLTSTSTGLVQYAGNLLYNSIIRGVIGLAAIVLLILGLWMIGRGQKVPQATPK